LSHAAVAWRSLSRSRRAVFGAVLLGSLALAGVFAEVVASPAPIVARGPSGLSVLPGVVHATAYAARSRADIDRLHQGDAALWPAVRFGPNTRGDAAPNAPAGADHPLGTDAEGRDLLARLVYGARTALGLSLGAVLLGMILGVALGGLAGYARGFWDDRLVRLVETVDTFPAIIVVALVRAIERQPSALSLVLAVAFVRWAEVARLVRAEVVRATTEEHVVAAKALGASPLRVFARHILPGALGPAIVSSVFGVASVVLLEAAISFLGMGAESRVASWGETLAEGVRDPARLRLLILPGVLLAATVGGTYLIAAALRDATDPRAVRER
jgi:ABC-type dipeptide/oligopeptide/nickel transport system permease subunit